MNACRNVACDNFGVAPLPFVSRGAVKKGSERIQDGYRIAGGGRGRPDRSRLECMKCGTRIYLKSNLAVSEELMRISRYLRPQPEPSCPNADCANHGRGVRSHPGLYRRYGRTVAGSQRYRCKDCGALVAERKNGRPQLKSYENKLVFQLLVNKSPIKAIARVAGLSPRTVYDKIDFIWRQCLAFAADREADLGKKIDRRLYIATDRQDYVINWTNRNDRKNVALTAVGSAESLSGYVFPMSLNFDPKLDQEETEAKAIVAGDFDITEPAFRKYARIWTTPDFLEAKRQDPGPSVPPSDGEDGVWSRVEESYIEMATIPDPEAKERVYDSRKLPGKGVEIHFKYTVQAHYRLLRRILSGAPRFAFFMDQDDTLRAGCLSAFAWEIKDGKADAFFVKINKKLTIDERRQLVKATKEKFDRIRRQLKKPRMTDWQIRLFLVSLALGKLPKRITKRDRWFEFPENTMAEPERAICHLTDRGDLGLMRSTYIYARASLHAIDRYFMQLRRLLSMLERPIRSQSTERMWYGYSPYNPAIIQKLLDIHRVYYNYCKLGDAKKDANGKVLRERQTPAMRLGLARGLVRPEDILYFGRTGDLEQRGMSPSTGAGQRASKASARATGAIIPASAEQSHMPRSSGPRAQ